MSESIEVKNGDVVQLRSGGPAMLVEYVYPSGSCAVIWHSIDGTLHREHLWHTLLQAVPTSPSQ